MVEIFEDFADEGRRFLAAAPASAEGHFSIDLPLLAWQGSKLTATATDATDNTSPFSDPQPITGLCEWFFSNFDNTVIPDNDAIESTVDVLESGNIEDLNVYLDVLQEDVGELVMRLESPSGTVVDLVAETVDGVNFTNTVFDDEAPQGIAEGTAPFTGRFQPVGSLAEVDGEEMAGTWTLQIDDVTATGGASSELREWGLCFNDPGSEGEGEGEGEDPPCESQASSDTPMALRSAERIISTLTVPSTLMVQDIDVLISMTCDSVSSLDVRLESPLGQEILLFSEVDNDGEDFDGRLDDEAAINVHAAVPPFDGEYQPGHALSIYDGADASGEWKLKILDLGNSTGTLWNWSLCIAGSSENPLLECPAESALTQIPDDGSGGWSAPVATQNVGTCRETFSTLPSPLNSVSWWGYYAIGSGTGESVCEPDNALMDFLIKSESGTVVEQWSSQEVHAERTGKYLNLGDEWAEITRFTWTPATPLNVQAAEISIQTSFEACAFHWLSSSSGDEAAEVNGEAVAYDLSLCIDAGGGSGVGPLVCAEDAVVSQGPDAATSARATLSSLNAGEGYESFSGLNGLAITELTWWGYTGEMTKALQPCPAENKFKIAFYSDGGGRPRHAVTCVL